jgi:DinB family protein
VYGDPCRECGYDWSIRAADAIRLIAEVPRRYAELLVGDPGTTRGAGLDWSTGAYVCHVVDNLRIWAERLAGSARGSSGEVVPYDAELLATARRYESVALEAALWSLASASIVWSEAVQMADHAGSTLVHPDRGELTATDVITTNAHDAYHHAWDLSRILGAPSAP